MDGYFKNLKKIEFVVTMACSGKCRHCSEGDHDGFSGHIDEDVAVDAFHQEHIPLDPILDIVLIAEYSHGQTLTERVLIDYSILDHTKQGGLPDGKVYTV